MSEDASSSPPVKDINNGPAILATTGVLLGIGIVFVLTRIYVRTLMSRNFGWDDGVIAVTLVLLIAGDVFLFEMVSVGVGRHLRYLSEPEFAVLQVVRWNTYYQIVNVIGAFTTKLSISLFILRIKSDRKLKAAVIIVMAFLAVSTLVTVITAGTQCIPLNKLWNPDMKGHCVSSNITHISSYVQSGFAIITDLFLTISPILILWNIRISMRKKLAIWGLMSLGLMATIANAMRNIYIPVLKASDLTYGITPILIVADLEFNLGVIAACLPTFMPLYKKFPTESLRSILSGKSRSTASTIRGWGSQRHLKASTGPISVDGAHTISDAKYERQNSSESAHPLREMDHAISFKRTYDVSSHKVGIDVEKAEGGYHRPSSIF